MRTESQTFLSPLFSPPLSKKKKPFIPYNLMVTLLAPYPHWPQKPKSQWWLGFSGRSLDCSNHQSLQPPMEKTCTVRGSCLLHHMKKVWCKTRLLAGVDFDGVSSSLWALLTLVLYVVFREQMQVRLCSMLFLFESIHCGPHTRLTESAVLFDTHHFILCIDILPHKHIWPCLTILYFRTTRKQWRTLWECIVSLFLVVFFLQNKCRISIDTKVCMKKISESTKSRISAVPSNADASYGFYSETLLSLLLAAGLQDCTALPFLKNTLFDLTLCLP